MRVIFMDLKLFKSLSKDFLSKPYYKDGKMVDFIDWLEFTKHRSSQSRHEYDSIYIGEVFKN